MVKSPSPFVDAYKAEDLQNLLDHIAWTDTIRPALLRERDNLTKLLVDATLGLPIQQRTVSGPVTISKEQLAGKIFGVDYVFSLFEKILAKGETAERELKAMGVNLH